MAPIGGGNRVIVRGLKELINALRACEGGVPRELRRELKEAAQPAAAEASARAPHASGELAASYRVRTMRLGAAVGSPLLKAPIINFGRQARVSGGKVAPHIRQLTPDSHLVPAVEHRMSEIRARVETAIALLLDRLIGGGPGG